MDGFVKDSRSPEKIAFSLGDEHVACKEVITHLEVVMDSGRREVVEIQGRPRHHKYYGAVNSVVAQLGGVCKSDVIWSRIVDIQLHLI